MNKNESVFEAFIVEIGDRIIEDGQTVLMNLDGLSNEVTLSLSDYLPQEETRLDIKGHIRDYLLNQEIKLYEDESDENGHITGSKLVYSKIFESVEFELLDNKRVMIKLEYGQDMMALLV